MNGRQIEIEGTRPGPRVSTPMDTARKDTMRPPLMDSEAEAEAYANKLIEELGVAPQFADKLTIPKSEWPPGWTYELKAYTIVGKDNNHHVSTMKQLGWRPVPTRRHPHKMPPGTNPEEPVIIEGLMLMELPDRVVKLRKDMENRDARGALMDAERKLHDAPPNTAPRDEPALEKLGIGVKRGYVAPAGAA